jgi:hypothetical protein
MFLIARFFQAPQRVRVLPVTHTMPASPQNGLEIPGLTKNRLGLDADRSWIVLDEANEFLWPGPDLRPLPGGGADSVAIGFLPPRFYRIPTGRLEQRYRARRISIVARSE